MPLDPLKDLTSVTTATSTPFVLLANPSVPANTLPEFIAHLKANPGKVTWSTVGVGGALHMSGEWLASAAGIKLTFVHYKGSAAAEADLIAGLHEHIDDFHIFEVTDIGNDNFGHGTASSSPRASASFSARKVVKRTPAAPSITR